MVLEELYCHQKRNCITFEKRNCITFEAGKLDNNNGLFSVRSAYNLETERLARDQGCTSSFSSSRDRWKLLWQLKIPRSVQLFLWRVCNDILPTKEKLWKRRIVDNPLCPFCGIEVESSIHAV
jgi:hypothetical protein